MIYFAYFSFTSTIKFVNSIYSNVYEMKFSRILALSDRADIAHPCAKTHNIEAPQLLAADPEIGQHLIFSSLGRKLLIDHFKKLIYLNASLSHIAQ